MLSEDRELLSPTATDQVSVNVMKTEQEHCCACDQLITDRFLLKVNGQSWHARCLRCCVCQAMLDRQHSCFIKEESVYCRSDYTREFGAKCSKCSRIIQPTDWVRRARDKVYHLACFACDSCKRQLSTGEEFALYENRVLCKTHYFETLDDNNGSNDESGYQEYHQKSKTKRVRTTFTEEQLQVLQANFNLDSNPDGQDLERIAQITGLSKRVTQVWFQNSRARQKKYLTNQAKKSGSTFITPVSSAAVCPGCGMMYCLCSKPSLHMNMVQVA